MHHSSPDTDKRIHFDEGMLHVVGPEARRAWKRPTTLQYYPVCGKAGNFTVYSYYLGPEEIEALCGLGFWRYTELSERDEARRTLSGGFIVRRTYDHLQRAKFSRRDFREIMEHYWAAVMDEVHRET